MWGRLLNGACPTQWTPSPPICDQEVVSRSIHTTIPWQPMPAVAREPSGTRVLVLCGQPGQNHGLRSAARGSSAASACSRAMIAPTRACIAAAMSAGTGMVRPASRLAIARAISAGDRSAFGRSSQPVASSRASAASAPAAATRLPEIRGRASGCQ